MNKLFHFIIGVFILSFYLPGGYLMGIPISNTLLFLVVLVILISFLQKRKIDGISKFKFLTLIIPLISLTIYYLVLPNTYYSSAASQQLNSFIVLLVVPFAFMLIIKNNIMNVSSLIKFVLLGFGLKLFVRFIIEILFILGFFNHDSLVEFYLNLFGSTPVTLFISGINAMRIQFPSDALPLVVYSFILIDKNLSRKIKLLSVICVAVFSLIVYSRIFIAQYILVTFLGIVINFSKLSLKKLFIIYCVFASIILIGGLLQGSFDFSILLNRFIGSEVSASDYIREQQYIFIQNSFFEKPFFGHGIGYYISGFIRSTSLPFSYELEYFSFLMQFGIAGFSLIVFGTILNFTSLITWRNLNKKELIFVLLNFGIWLFKPLFNPAFLTINSASIIVVLIVYSYYFSFRKSEFSIKQKIS